MSVKSKYAETHHRDEPVETKSPRPAFQGGVLVAHSSGNDKQGLPESVRQTVDRRTWMSWVGKAAVLSLGGGLLARCRASGTDIIAVGESRPTDTVTGESIWREEDAGADTAAEPELPESCPEPAGPLSFQANDGMTEIYESWPIRTVDPQSLEWILANWQLTVDGMVETPAVLSFADLLERPRQNQISDFHCVEGWSVYDVPWNGVHLKDIFNLVKPTPEATYVTFHTIDEAYNESLPIDIALEPMTLLAYGICDATLPLSHGFPLRLVVPRLLAYKSAKYVERIELTDHPVEGYWVARGYPYDAEVPESRLRDGRY